MAMSILHRITGCALYFGVLLFIWWIAAAAASAVPSTVQGIAGSWLGLLVLLGFRRCSITCGGIRHLIGIRAWLENLDAASLGDVGQFGHF